MDALLVDINQAGLGRGLQFELFRPAPAETKREFYAELPVTLKLNGSYHDMGQFASDIGQLSRIVTLNDIGLTGGKDGSLVMDVTAKTFRYLDEEGKWQPRVGRQRASRRVRGEGAPRHRARVAARGVRRRREFGDLKSELKDKDKGPARRIDPLPS